MDIALKNEDNSEDSPLLQRLIEEVTDRIRAGEEPLLSEYTDRYPECAEGLREFWDVILVLEQSHRAPVLEPDLAIQKFDDSSIGRYQIIRTIGQGGFGVVLLATDDQLDRSVAIKLPHLHRMQSPSTRQLYVQEAKMLAQLDHPSIVPVYDCGVIPDGRCFVVSKFIEGRDLAHLMHEGRIQPEAVADLIITVAEALEYVHRLKIVHRDIKPANILMGDDGRVYVADFGLALREVIMDARQPIAGTLRYMSPELLRREGHRIDGRSDQFSLGVVMYELLIMRSPFVGDSPRSLLQSILDDSPIEPHKFDRNVPRELSRICMRMMSKLASQRYGSMSEVARDLRDWKLNAPVADSSAFQPDAMLATTQLLGLPISTSSSDAMSLITPRGLRPFSREDAYFFPSLLPGARDRDGIPITIGQWKRWILTEDEPLDLRRVGVISGPTGSGKSSFVRAGLIPTLGRDVVTVIADATADTTERTLLTAIQHAEKGGLRGSAADQDREGSSSTNPLADRIASVRRNGGIHQGKKLLIVIDQFEQWLLVHSDPIDTPLAEAMRQCDGHSVQCLLLVRDDFWLGLSRFTEAVESPVQMGRNGMMMDLFDRSHATKVLKEFGRGYGKLPPTPIPLSRDQERFLDGAIESLLQDGKVIPVHLAIFAEMVKSREWTSAILRKLGGTIGIGAQFLMEAFTAKYAPAKYRMHEQAAKEVLSALLPPLGTNIKACQKSRSELQKLSGYADNGSAFENLLSVLELDLKLVSPTDTFDQSRSDVRDSGGDDATFQLSHDFLVPSIREWLSSTLRRSWRGRLKQRLDEQSSLWNAQPEPRFLPNMVEGAAMRWLLPQRSMTQENLAMLASRGQRSVLWLSAFLIGGLLLFWGANRWIADFRIKALVTQLTTASADMVPDVMRQLHQQGNIARDAVDLAIQTEAPDSQNKFVLQVAQLHWSREPAKEVFEQITGSNVYELMPIAIEGLKPYRKQFVSLSWDRLKEEPSEDSKSFAQEDSGNGLRLRLGQLLATLDPPIEEESKKRWTDIAPKLANALVQQCTAHPDKFAFFVQSLKPVHDVLRLPLAKTVGSRVDDTFSRFAISALEGMSREDIDYRTTIALDGDDWQRAILLPKLDQLPEKILWESVQGTAPHRKAVAASLLLARMEKESIVQGREQELWSLLSRKPDNTCRSLLIEQLAKVQIGERVLLRQLSNNADAGVVSAALMVLGELSENGRAPSSSTKQAVLEIYRKHPDAGVHSAALWCLRMCNATNDEMKLKPSPIQPSSSNAQAEELVAIRQWLIEPNGQLMVRIPMQQEGIGKYDLMVAATEVTVEQFLESDPGKYIATAFSPSSTCPANVVTWPAATGYCNWLSERHGLPKFYPTDPEELMRWTPSPDKLLEPGYRLPVAREWSTAFRGGTDTEFYFGTDLRIVLRHDWFQENAKKAEDKRNQALMRSGSQVKSSKYAPSQPVGTLRPNEYGLFDMCSNVVEWMSDAGVNNPSEREIRGFTVGAFLDKIDLSDFASGSSAPLVQYDSYGLRVVRACKSDP